MVISNGSLLTGVDASAAQKQPVTKTCLQCSAVLPSSVRVCNFCDSSLTLELSSEAGFSAPGVQERSRTTDLAGITRMLHPARIRILPGVASLHSVSKPIGPGGERLRLTLRSQRFRSRNLRQIRRFMLPLMSLKLRSQPMRISPSQSRSAEMRRRVKTREWSLMYPCLRLRNRASNKPTQETSAQSRLVCIQSLLLTSAGLPA